ncbi:MAG: helix-turn-helix domain-containing protein [Sphingobium sp.]
MNEDTEKAETPDPVESADRPGALLRRAREARGMSLADVAEVTRIAQRQLEAVERSDFGALPGTPYAVGFARAYARAVGADEVEVARGVREELGALGEVDRYEAFEPVDPARIPPRSLAWVAAGIAVLLAIAYGVWRTQFFTASTDEEISDLNNRATAAQPPAVRRTIAAPAAQTGPVVLTANTDVWLRIYDQAGERLFEKQMSKGESFTVPPEANNPMILTGRPNALDVTVGGTPVPPLGAPEKTISDVPVSAAALLARPPAGEAAAPPPPRPTAAAPARPRAATGAAQASQPVQASQAVQPAQAPDMAADGE